MFHVSLLRDWKAADVQEDQLMMQEDAPEVEEPYWEIEKTSYGGGKFKRNKKMS